MSIEAKANECKGQFEIEESMATYTIDPVVYGFKAGYQAGGSDKQKEIIDKLKVFISNYGYLLGSEDCNYEVVETQGLYDLIHNLENLKQNIKIMEQYKVVALKFKGSENGLFTYELTFNRSLEHTGKLTGIEKGLNDYELEEKKEARNELSDDIKELENLKQMKLS